MKSIQVSTLVLTLLLHTADANFDVYMSGIGGDGITANVWAFQVYDSPPACHDVIDWIWQATGDVSGDKYGVRCKGSDAGCSSSGDPSDIEELEMNFNTDEYHWTMYANRDWGLFDLKDNKVGTCMPFPDETFYCGVGLGQVVGVRKIRCLIDSVNSEDINSHRPV